MKTRNSRLKTVSRFIAIAYSTMFVLMAFQSPLTGNTAVAADPDASRVCSIDPSPSTHSGPKLGNYTFPPGTFVMPMDNKQADMTAAFGFAHAMLRNGSYLYRIINPPNESIKTDAFPAGEEYRGGPILFMPQASDIVNIVHPSFPAVVLQLVTENYISHRVFIVREPNTILWMDGGFGKTNKLLEEMKIPYTKVSTTTYRASPQMIWDYTLFIDDCSGLYPWIDNNTAEIFRNYVAAGNEIIFTCYALRDFKFAWPTYITGPITNVWQTRDSNITEWPDFPAQYDGPKNVTLYQIWTQAVPMLKNSSEIAQGKMWDDAMYYNYGKGIAEFFSFHPGEQIGDGRRAAIILYGNKFLHFSPGGDKTVMGACAVAPKDIATKGTSLPEFEKTTVTLTAKPVGFNVIRADNCMVNYRLNPYIDNVTGSFKDPSGNPLPPDSAVVNGDNSKSLMWKVMKLPMNALWKVNFDVTSTKAGKSVVIEDWKGSNVSYTDEWSYRRTYFFVDLKINVTNKYGIPEFGIPAIGAALIVTACLAVAAIDRRKK